MSVSRPPTSNTTYLRLFFLLAALEGAAVFIYLLSLPSDPGGILFGYSAARLAMLGIALVGVLVFIALTIRTPSRMADFLFDDRKMIPNLLFSALCVSLVLAGWMFIFQTKTVLKLNEAYLSRLIPFFLWGFLLAFQAAMLWVWCWHRPRIKLQPNTLDAVLLLIIFLLSLGSRALLTGYGLPYQSVWDEPVTYGQALNMLTTPGLRPAAVVPGYGRASYGDLPVYITAAAEVVGLMEGLRSQEVTSVQEYVSPPSGVASIYQAVNETGLPLRFPRLFFALINSIAPVLIYLILRRFFAVDPLSAFGGALLMAFLSRDVLYYSSYILPDALAVTLSLGLFISVWLAMDSRGRRWTPWLISGILAGIIVSVNIRMVAVVVVPFLGLLLAKRDHPTQAAVSVAEPREQGSADSSSITSDTNLKSILIYASVILGGMVLGFVITSPYAILDLPNYIEKWTSFYWSHDLTLTHRLDSLAFYLKGLFMPGFGDSYIDTTDGSIGFGVPAGLLAAVGICGLLKFQPRRTLVMLIFAALQLYLISPIVQRYTRHALMLYPIVAIAAGMGLSMIVRALQRVWEVRVPNKGRYWSLVQKAIPTFVLVVFLVVYAGQIYQVERYIARNLAYQTAQQRATEYLTATVKPGEKIGILDILPWVESDLEKRGINFVRVGLHDSVEQWQSEGLAYVVGTDRLQATYGSADNTSWAQSAGLNRIAEFGDSALSYIGYPTNEIYFYVAPVPGAPGGADAVPGGSP